MASAHGSSQNNSDNDLEATLVGSLADYNSVRLFKHHQQLFAVAENSDQTISIYETNKHADSWELMSDTAQSIADLVSNTAAVDTFAVRNHLLYTGTVNSDGVAEVWSIPEHRRPATWERVGETGLGDTTNTAIVDLFNVRGQGLYALTENPAGNGLFHLHDGAWEQVGTYGLGVDMTDAVAAGEVRIVGHVVNVASASGAIYQASTDDLTSWSLVSDFTTEITTMRGRFVATSTAGEVKVYESDASNQFNQVGQTDLGDSNNDAVTRFVNITGHPALLTSNAIDGAAFYRLNNETGEWELKLGEGFGNANNESTTDFIWYRGNRYVATNNTTDGSEIYRFE
jgi:hypothetical protein